MQKFVERATAPRGLEYAFERVQPDWRLQFHRTQNRLQGLRHVGEIHVGVGHAGRRQLAEVLHQQKINLVLIGLALVGLVQVAGDEPLIRILLSDSGPTLEGDLPVGGRLLHCGDPDDVVLLLICVGFRDAFDYRLNVRSTLSEGRADERENERKSMSREEFLANLGARVGLGRFILASDERFPRAFELLNKTNQFNTDGKRWTIQEMHDFFADGGQIITFNVFDKFTDYGLVGVILLQPSKIAQFVMSCRVLGLDVEIGVLRYIMRTIRGGGHGGPIEARIVETEANMPSRDVYKRAGFSDLGGGRYAFEAPEAPDITNPTMAWWYLK